MTSQTIVENALEVSSEPFITYNVTVRDDTVALADDLSVMTEILFDILPANYYMKKSKASLLEAVENIRSYSMTSVIYRADNINRLLKDYIDTIIAFQRIKSEGTHENGSRNFDFKGEYYHRSYYDQARNLKNFTKALHKNIRPLTTREGNELEAKLYSLTAESIKMDGTASPVVSVFLPLRDLNDDSIRVFNDKRSSRGGTVGKCRPIKAGMPQLDDTKEKETEDWLKSISLDAFNAYIKTQETLAEAVPLLDNTEDKYFVEQVHADYYPHIFAALKKYDTENSDFEHKEAVVTESIKQFRIVQLGLQKIIDGSVTRHMNSLQSQTEFLRTKVLGDAGLSLTPNEVDTLIEDSVEEANLIREELYKKHVAPILEQNKQEYREALSNVESEAVQKLQKMEKEIAEWESRYHNEMSRLVEQAKDISLRVDKMKQHHQQELALAKKNSKAKSLLLG